MTSRFISLGLALLGCTLASSPAGARHDAAYAVIGRVPGPDGSYDYASVDPATGRVFVGRDSGVEILDPGARRMHTLLARKGVAAVLPIGADLMLSTDGDENRATLYDRHSGRVVVDIPTGEAPDGAAYDAATGLAFVMNGGSHDITLIDVAQARTVGTIALEGAPEAAVADNGRLFVNVEDRNEIAVIDIAGRTVIAHYPLARCNEPTAIVLDSASGLLISACHNRVAKLIAAADGDDRGDIAIGAGADGAIFDPVRRIGFVSCIDGTLTVFRLGPSGNARIVQVLKTRVGARTMAYDSLRDRLYLPSAIVERDRKGKYIRAERAFALLVVGRR